MRIKKAAVFLGALFFSVALVHGKYLLTDGFSVHQIMIDLPPATCSGVNAVQRAALGQQYYYLAKGHHSIAFESADRQWVIKFLRFNKFKPKFWASLFSCSYCQSRQANRLARLQFIRRSHKIAAKILPQETGVCCLHFHKTADIQKMLTLVDRSGRRLRIDPDGTAFVLQRRLPLYGEAFDEFVRKNDMAAVDAMICSYFKVIAARCQKLIMNKDRRGWRCNYGLDKDNKAYEIDLGAFVYEPNLLKTEYYVREFTDCSLDFRVYLQKHLPEKVAFFDQELFRAINVRS